MRTWNRIYVNLKNLKKMKFIDICLVGGEKSHWLLYV